MVIKKDTTSDKNNPIVALHRYFIWTNKMRTLFDEYLEQNIKNKVTNPKAWKIESNMYMSLWYGLLYVLVEGWEDMKLSDKKIDSLLASPNKNLLKRYRNACFHFQKQYNNEKFEVFYKEKTTVEWVRDLNREFGRWFLEYYKSI